MSELCTNIHEELGMNKPSDYEYRYALSGQLEKYRQEGWELIAYAGHGVDHAPVLFIRRRLGWYARIKRYLNASARYH
jgi:hypothetical protein